MIDTLSPPALRAWQSAADHWRGLDHCYLDLSRVACSTTHLNLRTAPRMTAEEPLQLWIPEHFDVPLLSHSVNEGAGGLGLHSPVPLDPGTMLSVRPMEEYGDDAWVPLEVRHCQPDPTGWTLGCRYVAAGEEIG